MSSKINPYSKKESMKENEDRLRRRALADVYLFLIERHRKKKECETCTKPKNSDC